MMRKKSIGEFLGAWGEGDAEEIQKEMKEIRKRISESIERRMEKLKAQIMDIESSELKDCKK